MHIQYYLSDGQEISYSCVGTIPSLEDVDCIATMYASMRPNDLPTTIFCSVRIYRDFINSFFQPAVNVIYDKYFDVNLASVHTSVGVLSILPLPMASDAKLFMIGKKEDYDRYDIDKIFEEVVLKDCPREE